MFTRNNILLLLALFALFVALRAIFGFNGLYGQDAFEYYRYSAELSEYWTGGNKPADFMWPYLYPLQGSIFQFLFVKADIALQLVSLLSFFGICLYLIATLNKFYPDKKHIEAYVIALLISCPFFFRAAFLCMSDMSAAFFATACLCHFLFYTRAKQWSHFTCCVSFAALSFFTRYGMAALVLIPVLFCFYLFLKKISVKALITTSVSVGIILLPHILLKNETVFSFTQHTFLSNWSPLNFFRNNFFTPDEGDAIYALWNLPFYFGNLFYPVYLVAGLPLLPFAFRNLSRERKIILASVIAYLLFLSGMPSQNKRYILPVVPFMVIFLFEGFSTLAEIIPRNKIIFSSIAALTLLLNTYAFSIVYKRMKLEKSIFEYLSGNWQGKPLYTFDVEVALRGYRLNSEVISLWTEEFEGFDSNALVLFNEKNFSKQWSSHILFRNWKKIKSEKHLKPLHDFGEGWKLYEIQ